MMKRDNSIYISHIIECFSKAQSYIDGVNFEDFLIDEEKQDAVIRKIEVAGEATKKVSKELREKFNHIPWKAIAGMRDKLIHDYFDVDLYVVWDTVTKEIPIVKESIKEVAEYLDSQAK